MMMKNDICDGCMNGCSLSQPGCQRGMQKSGQNVTPYQSLAAAQDEFLRRQAEMQTNSAQLQANVDGLFHDWKENFITKEDALRPDLAGMQIFEQPIWGISNAFDPLYRDLKKPDIVGPWHKLPGDFLKGSKRVISLFFPYTEQIKEKQRTTPVETTPEWLHGRIEGNAAMLAFTKKLCETIKAAGCQACVPITEPGYQVVMNGVGISGYKEISESTFGCTWSERHVAFISGLGTFGLSRGLITEKGMAGRFCSIVTDMLLPVTERTYNTYDEWCTKCGRCAERCPVHAISLQTGKDHIPCGKRIDKSKILYAPRYGCGQCQTAVPCESQRPT